MTVRDVPLNWRQAYNCLRGSRLRLIDAEGPVYSDLCLFLPKHAVQYITDLRDWLHDRIDGRYTMYGRFMTNGSQRIFEGYVFVFQNHVDVMHFEAAWEAVVAELP